MWTDAETDPRTAGDTSIDMERVYGTDTVDAGTETRQKPMRYEDALRAYLRGDMDLSTTPDVQKSVPNVKVDADTEAGPTVGSDNTQGTAPKPKTQVISELAQKISKPGITPGRAMIAAEQTYADAERRFGPDAQTVLEQLQPGQDPRRFLDGFQNAYLAGKMGDSAALKHSGAAAYLTEEQRLLARELGEATAQKHPAGIKTDNRPESIPPTKPEGKKTDLLSTLENGTIEEKRTAFRKAFQEGLISTRISPQKQAGHIWGTKQFLEQDTIMARKGDHPSYLREDISESDLEKIVIPKLRGELTTSGKRTCEFVLCDEVIGYYYSKAKGGYVETRCAQVIYAVAKGNIHIVPVKNLIKGEEMR